MSTMREIQLCTFEILKEVVRICDKHNLTYYLNFGTLLGSVRHKGFIPWDNDIDIEMPIDDYWKFLKIAPEEISEDFFIQTHKSDHGYNLVWTQVRANNTTSMPVKFQNWDIHWGIHMDIYPLSGVANSKLGKKIQEKGLELSNILINKEFLQACEPHELGKNWKLRLLYRLPRSLREVLCSALLRVVLKNPYKCKYCSALEWRLRFRLDPLAYRNKTNVEFEGKIFSAPAEYDYILTTIYGDYMTPPPENKRYFGHEGVHGQIIYDHTKDYSAYRS